MSAAAELVPPARSADVESEQAYWREQQQTHEAGLSQLAHRVLVYLPGNLIPAVLALVSTSLFTRMFGAAAYGQYSLALSAVTLATALSSQWLIQAVVRYLPSEALQNDDPTSRQAVVAGLLCVWTMLATAALLLLPICSRLLPEWRPFLIPSVLMVLTQAAYATLMAVLQAQAAVKSYSGLNLLNAGLKLVAAVGIVCLIYKGPSAIIVGVVVANAIILPLAWRVGRLPSFAQIGRVLASGGSTLRPHLVQFARYGLPMIGWFLATNVLMISDRYVIQFFRGSAEVGIYSANFYLIQGATTLLTAPLLLAAHPMLMKAWNNDRQEDAAIWLGRIIEWALGASVLLVVLVGLFSADIAEWLLGPDFREGHHIMPITLSGVLAWQIGLYLHKPLEFREKTGVMLAVCAACAVLNVCLNVATVPSLGYTAAAYNTVIAATTYNITVAVLGRRRLAWPFRWRGIALAGGISLSCSLALPLMRNAASMRYGPEWAFALSLILASTIAVATLVALGMRALTASPPLR